ncbi:hypothetical protein RIF29_15693 [Crotalaria pallida]|uniref:Uncharacterized protein n=1 Tax=Crotalaria pallida TaxID=3830 RepID=A0AAN9ICU1_CROPI
MAATVSAWSKPVAWAIESEQHEAELLQSQPQPETTSFWLFGAPGPYSKRFEIYFHRIGFFVLESQLDKSYERKEAASKH